MSEDVPADGRLSAEECARLDPQVDVARLEAFLALLPTEARRWALQACWRDPAPGERSLVGSANPELQARWRAVCRDERDVSTASQGEQPG